MIPLTKVKAREETKAQKKVGKEERKTASLTKKSGKKVAKEMEGMNLVQISRMFLTSPESQAAAAVDEPADCASSTDPKPDTELTGMENHKIKRRNNSRRSTAKSEPNRTTNESLDGVVDYEITAVGGEESGLAMV